VPAAVFTVGHSTQEHDRFIALLRAHGVTAVADVRRYPRSRRHPQFDAAALAAALPAAGIAYLHLPELGGRRSRRPGSPNGGWAVAGFQGYADYMATPAFAAGLARLQALADERVTTVMCAEGAWWRCHRRLIADALVSAGRRVRHILPDGRTTDHELTPFAVVEGGAITYPGGRVP
jgi:uncharacterized protein (DUF488 family)